MLCSDARYSFAFAQTEIHSRAWQDLTQVAQYWSEPFRPWGQQSRHGALEAFAAGVPVLGANLGGIAEVGRAGVHSILVASDDAAAWARRSDG
jgi:glycosyltransferase involved in cell wall biosynthesis